MGVVQDIAIPACLGTNDPDLIRDFCFHIPPFLPGVSFIIILKSS